MVRPTRRQILAAVVLAGAGGAGAQLAIGAATPARQPSPSGGRARPEWDAPVGERARVAQLLRRTTFGATSAELESATRDGFASTVERLLETPFAEAPRLVADDDPTRGARLTAEDLQRWWLAHLLTSPTRFGERMTYFWHNHFTSDVDKVGGLFMYWQNLTWRRMALGRLGDMLARVTVDPAMLVYLNLADSDASDEGQPPNENYARELLELFTMGPGPYREGDVKAAARALAGWTTPAADREVEAVTDEATGARETFDVWDRPSVGHFDTTRAHRGAVTFLGRSGRLDLEAVIQQALARPETAHLIARKVAVHFISANPAVETVDGLADVFRRSGHDVKALVRAAFVSAEFAAPQSYRSLIKSPLELMVGAALAVGLPAPDAVDLIVGSTESAGEVPFSPPNVAGWPPNRGWVSPATLLARFNFAGQLVAQRDPLPAAMDAVDVHLDGVLGDSTRRRLTVSGTERERWLALLTGPEFQLK